MSVDSKQLEAIVRSALQQLIEQKYYPTVDTPEFAKAFVDGLLLGVHKAVADFESTPRQYPPQAADAGATQDASV